MNTFGVSGGGKKGRKRVTITVVGLSFVALLLLVWLTYWNISDQLPMMPTSQRITIYAIFVAIIGMFTLLLFAGLKVLRDTEDRLHRAVASSPVVLYSQKVTESGFAWAWMSTNLPRFTGHKIEATASKSWWSDNLHPADRERVLEAHALPLPDDHLLIRYRFRCANGQYIWIRDEKTLHRDKSGNPKEVIGSWVDVTERKQAEAELLQSERMLELAGQMSKLGGWAIDFPEKKLSWTKEVFHIHDLPRDHPITMDEAFAFFAPEWRTKVREAIETCARDGKAFSFEVELVTAQQRRIWVRSMGEAEIKDGEVQRIFGTFQDITEAKTALLNLRESEVRLLDSLMKEQELTRQAKAGERAKSDFLATMSHEIRTPMNGVIGMTSILADTVLTDTQRDCVTTIQASGEALLTVINDILDFSKIESGRMDLEQRSFSLLQCIEESFDLFAPQFRSKNIEAGYLIAAEIPANVIGDFVRLRQILTNLIGNAVKFTKEGEITLNVDLEGHDEKGYHLRFAVKDSGIGIPREAIGKLFHSFQQVDTSTTRRYGGSGLGLVICKRLTELMHGEMWVESEPGIGSTFFFTVVFEAAAIVKQLDSQPLPMVVKTQSVLVVDDNETNRRILDTQLKAWGMKPACFASAQEALANFKSMEYDVALLDMQMPEMDGLALAGEIRKQSPVPMILLSSMGSPVLGDQGDLFQAQIPKPIKQSRLYEALQQVAFGRTKSRKAAAKRFDAEMAAAHPLRILLAEDNAINLKVVLMMLAKLGYRADTAKNGHEALAALERTSYDVILMDIQMPEMDGLEATKIAREKMRDHCPYIIALTAEALEGDRDRFLSQGFDDYLSKPLQPEPLQAALRAVVPPSEAKVPLSLAAA